MTSPWSKWLPEHSRLGINDPPPDQRHIHVDHLPAHGKQMNLYSLLSFGRNTQHQVHYIQAPIHKPSIQCIVVSQVGLGANDSPYVWPYIMSIVTTCIIRATPCNQPLHQWHWIMKCAHKSTKTKYRETSTMSCILISSTNIACGCMCAVSNYEHWKENHSSSGAFLMPAHWKCTQDSQRSHWIISSS